jgi:hypothetical protein
MPGGSCRQCEGGLKCEREWRHGSIDVTDVTIGIKVMQISVAHKTVNSEPKNIILGLLESL